MLGMMINQSLKYALFLSAFGAFFAWYFLSSIQGFALLFGVIWTSLNIYFIGLMTQSLLITKNYSSLFPLFLIKFPLLYWIGYELLKVNQWDLWYLVLGLPFVFCVIAVNSITRFLVRSV